MVILVNNRVNRVTCNDRLVVVAFDKFKFQFHRSDVNRCFGRGVIIKAFYGERDRIGAFSVFSKCAGNGHRFVFFIGHNIIAAWETGQFFIIDIFDFEHDRLNRLAGGYRLRCIFGSLNTCHPRLMNYINGCKSGVVIYFALRDNFNRECFVQRFFIDGSIYSHYIILYTYIKRCGQSCFNLEIFQVLCNSYIFKLKRNRFNVVSSRYCLFFIFSNFYLGVILFANYSDNPG